MQCLNKNNKPNANDYLMTIAYLDKIKYKNQNTLRIQIN